MKDGRAINNDKIKYPLKTKVLLIFIISLTISVSCFSLLFLINWTSSSKKTTKHLAVDINEQIYNKIFEFIKEPHHMNEVNHKVFENGMLDLNNTEQRERFFVGVLEAHSDGIYSFSYGTANGEYYGARRNEHGVIEIMRNNAETGGNSLYYSVKDDFTAGELVVRAGKFDPRTRAWYRAAVQARGPVFSPVYSHFVMDDLAVSAAWPIYNKEGVLEGVIGTHVLLSNIGSYLKDAIEKYNGIAFIIEKGSNFLIANSLGEANFSVLRDGTLIRYGLDDLGIPDIWEAYEQYMTSNVEQIFYKGENENYFVNMKELHLNGINWIVVSAIPESLYMKDVFKSMRWASILGVMSVLLSMLVYSLFMRRALKPLKTLLQVSGEFSVGNLSRRIKVTRNDEIGLISESFNSVADKMQSLIENLENTVRERTEELHGANATLEASKEELQLILDSAAEGIYGIDLDGNCTFCNKSCVRLLGYSDQSELLGKNMHWQIHHSYRDGTPIPLENCKIFQAFLKGESSHEYDQVFWRADGTYIEVEYYAYPQVKNGEIVGAVISFMDIGERKKQEAEIQYLSSHDTLTGPYNRRSFEEICRKIDKQENLPLSVIFADINGLKMTNDIFGHRAGDNLIRKTSEILKQVCRKDDIIARIGGDEFVILLQNTTGESAGTILDRIRASFENAHVEAVKCSISLGFGTKRSPDQSLEEIMARAENDMYKDKTMNRSAVNKDIIDTIIGTLHTRNPKEKQHSVSVSELCSYIGKALNLPENEIGKLKRAGYLHDIGKIVLDEELLSRDNILSAEENEKKKQHTAVGYRILNLFDDTLDLAELVYGHHERWDGTGYPRGLKGRQIPFISRIIAIAETYDRVLNRSDLPYEERKQAALEVIREGAGKKFDPQIAEFFVKIMSGKKDDNLTRQSEISI